ncbi:MAG TPA: DinB family protein [Puia sp.]|nr:DinB family protein [Puia sp.]
MNKEIQSIINNLQTVLNAESWYGTSVYKTLEEAGKTNVYKHPEEKYHSQIEILYHMITWAEFILASLEKGKKHEIEAIEAIDWRTIDPTKHTWQNGVHELKSANESIIAFLQIKEDDFLKEMVEFRKYNVRFLLNGLIQHHIYHAGQIAYLKNICE